MSKKHLTAKDAEDISSKAKKEISLEKVLELIKEESERGCTNLNRVPITMETKEELEKLGYKVSYSNFFQTAFISWSWYAEEKYRPEKQEIRNDEAYVALDRNGMITICCPFNDSFAGITRHAKNIMDMIYRQEYPEFKEKKGGRLTAKDARENSDIVKDKNIKSLDFILDLINNRSKEGRYQLNYSCQITEEDMSELKKLGFDVYTYICNHSGDSKLRISWDKESKNKDND